MTGRDHHAIVVRPADGPLAAMVGRGHGGRSGPSLPESSPERGEHGGVSARCEARADPLCATRTRPHASMPDRMCWGPGPWSVHAAARLSP